MTIYLTPHLIPLTTAWGMTSYHPALLAYQWIARLRTWFVWQAAIMSQK